MHWYWLISQTYKYIFNESILPLEILTFKTLQDKQISIQGLYISVILLDQMSKNFSSKIFTLKTFSNRSEQFTPFYEEKLYYYLIMLSLYILRNVMVNFESSWTFTETYGDSTNINRFVSWLLISTAARWKMKNEYGAGPIIKDTKKLLSRNCPKSYPAAMKAPRMMAKTLTMMFKEYCFL